MSLTPPNFGRPDYEAALGQAAREYLGIPAGEPLILFRAQDKFAAGLVRAYAIMLAGTGARPAMVEHAHQLAEAMEAWPVKKIPDLAPDTTFNPGNR